MVADTPGFDTVFCSAIEIDSTEERAAYIARTCGDNQELRQRVEKLVDAHFRAGQFLETPARTPAATIDEPIREGPGTVIGPYKLLQQIGEGGMGTVFMAEQTHPVQRKVALKVIKAGMDSRQVIARFEAERQALAMMDHVNIARVLDAGATESGRPYFVMELVHGVPITKYCDDNHLTPRERLELFVPVCQAIQHAHQKGIIHRDIKPSNVMITLYDGKPVPKVIDFGVAKATEQRLTERTLFTQYGTMLGTLEYMSPEQAEMSALGVDTRSDIYSLGVLLYELLTGSTPLTPKRIKEAAYAEILRMIKEEEPPKPSTRLSDSGEALASISALRKTEPAKLSKLVRGELDWIVMKTLEKDRNRRYETANGFAADVQRYLNDETVQACPPSAGYRLQKFVRRNKGPVAASLALAALLLLGTVGTSIGLAWALQAERTATLAAEAEAKQRQDAETQRDRADTERAKAVASEADTKVFSEFLVEDVLAVARPKGERGGLGIGVTVKAALDAAVPKIPERFRDRPRAEAIARHDLGVTYRLIGELDKSEEQLRRAYELRTRTFGPDHEDTLISGNSLAVLYRALGQDAKAEPLLIQTLEIRRRVLGEEHPDTLQSMNNLSVVYYEAQGQYAKAEPLLVKALEVGRRVLGEEHPDTLQSMNVLAGLYQAQGRFAKAEPLLVQTLEAGRRIQGEEHPNTLRSMTYLANLYRAQSQFAKAEPLLVQTLEAGRRIQGEEHPDTLGSMVNLAGLYESQRQFAEAETLYVKALELFRRVLGEEHPKTLTAMNNLAHLYRELGQFPKAEPLMARALEVGRRVLGDDHLETLSLMNGLASLSWSANNLDRSVPLFEKVLKRYQATLGPDHSDTLLAMANLGVNYRDAGRLPEGLALLEQAWAMAQKQPGPLPDSLAWLPQALAQTYDQAGQFAKSEPIYREALENARASHGAGSQPVAGALGALGRHLLKQKKYADADSLLRECLKIREQKEPDDWRTFNTKSLLGGSLLGQRNYAEAEPLLLSGYEGMKQREEKLPPPGKVWLTEATERLVQLYEATGKKEIADEWRKKLPAAKAEEPTETKKD